MTKVLVALTLTAASCAAPARTADRIVSTPLASPHVAPSPEASVGTEARAVEPTHATAVKRPASSGDMTNLPSNQIEQQILLIFGINGPRAVRIARCESSNFAPEVVYGPKTGSAGELGLMQILPRYHRHRWQARGWTDADMFIPERNLVIAREIYDESGFGPWTCRGAA